MVVLMRLRSCSKRGRRLERPLLRKLTRPRTLGKPTVGPCGGRTQRLSRGRRGLTQLGQGDSAANRKPNSAHTRNVDCVTEIRFIVQGGYRRSLWSLRNWKRVSRTRFGREANLLCG